jgi:hypothetical protein
MTDFGIHSTHDKWMVEKHGVDADIGVENTPDSGVDRKDLQLVEAIRWSLVQLKKVSVNRPARPADKGQTASTHGGPTDSGR